MADTYDGRDGSKRMTYRVCLGRSLSPGNTGAMQWGVSYRAKHIHIWHECVRLLKVGGILVINISNHIRDGRVIDVVGWHRNTLCQRPGLKMETQIDVPTPRMKFGANRNLRVQNESILVFQRV